MYPLQEPDSLFLHLIIAHELGHSATTEFGIVDSIFGEDPDPAQTRAELAAAVVAYTTAEGATPPVARAKVRAILRKWLTELICDGLALGFFGPSFLYTAAAFSTPFGGPEPSDTHPPFTLRTTFLLRHLDTWGWESHAKAATPATWKWIERAAGLPLLAGRRTYYLRLEETLKRLLPVVTQVLADHLGDDRFAPAAFDEVSDELKTLLEHDILPAQLLDRSAAGRRAIIFAGWLQAFNKHGDGAAGLAAIVGDRALQRFLSKALEMSVVLERWAAL